MGNHEINLVTAQTFDLSRTFPLPKTISLNIDEVLHLGLVIVSFVAFIIFFFWKLNEVQLGSYKSPLNRVISGAITAAISPLSHQKAIEIKTILK